MDNINFVTKSVYSVGNQQHLEEHKTLHGLSLPSWAGFHQWKEVGRKVSKGAKGCKIFMVCDKKITNKKGEDEKKQVVKALYVFNIEHTEVI